MKKNTGDKSDSKAEGIFELFGTLVTALIIVVMIMTFLFRQVTVSGDSMEPTFLSGERLIISTNYGTMPSDNDIVIVSHGQDYDEQIIKRVIATSGQTLSINSETNQVIVDGVVLDEPYIKGKTFVKDPNMNIPSKVPDGYVFVMGDNREVSLDSRSTKIGLIPVNNIIGTVQIRVFPFDKFGLIN